jgi:zinc-ribbon domain
VADRYCSNCGYALSENDHFCPNCGRPVHQTAHVPTPEADVPVPPPPRQRAEGTAPPPPQAGAPITQQPRSRRRLLVGLGALGAVIVVGLVATLTYPTLGGSPSEEVAAEKPPSEEAAVEEAVRGFYGALDAGNFEKAYSYYGPDHEVRHKYNQQEYDNYLKEQMIITEASVFTVHSVKVRDVSGNTATAIVDFEREESGGTSRYLSTWKLIKLDGQWKNDKLGSIKEVGTKNEATSQSASATQSASASAAATDPADPFVGRWQVSSQTDSSASASANDPFTVTITKEGEIYQVVLVRTSGGTSATYVGRYDEADGSLRLEPDFCGDMSLSDDGDQLYWCREVFTRVSQ